MPGLKILITNWTMCGRHGSVMYIRDLALGLLRAGHVPIVYSPELGEVAAELLHATVPVVDNLYSLGESPDVIHGNSHGDTMTALVHFPGVPAVFTCHAWDIWLAEPPRFPRLRRYIAVDHTCRDWLLWKRGLARRQVGVIFNAFDPQRFAPRPALPARLARAAVFSNYAVEHTYLSVVRDACRQLGLALDVIGSGVGNACANPETILGKYDLVFAKGRCALEALAVGTAVLLCDFAGLGPLVTTHNWDQLRQLNFGRRALREAHRADWIVGEIGRYCAADAKEVSNRTRAEAGLPNAIQRWVEVYQEVVEEQQRGHCGDATQETVALAHYLHWINSNTALHTAQNQVNLLEHECRRLETELANVCAKLQRPWTRRKAAVAQVLRAPLRKLLRR